MRYAIRWFGRIVLTGGLFVCLASAQDSSSVKSDNTKTNKGNTPTADQQKDKKSDRQTAQQIRKAITSDKSLSTYAHNVKVIVQDGVVTLKGPVRSEDEKRTIEQKATEVAGASNVKNEITIVSADTSNKKSKDTVTK